MYCTRKITEDIYWVGADDRRLAMFEGVYSVPRGVSYNSYLVMDDHTVLFDTVDKAVSHVFFENIENTLAGRELDYVVIQHMEPDHSASLLDLILRYPNIKIVCNKKISVMLTQFLHKDMSERTITVGEGDKFSSGKHEYTFVMAPMVHWPEVMVTYDSYSKALFSADAFGTFGALNGAIFADEVDFYADYLGEARRYYCNIVGKYGPQVQALLKKAATLDIGMICPLHGFVHRKNIGDFVDKYNKWSLYVPEETGVVIAYASVYGNTENAANILACKLRENGVKTVIHDVSVTPASEIISDMFRYSHIVLASTTYNAGIFVTMEALLHDLAAHNLQNRTIAIIENGSWAPTSGRLMQEIVSKMKNMTLIGNAVTLKSSLSSEQMEDIDALASEIISSIPKQTTDAHSVGEIDQNAIFSLTYGLFALCTIENGKDNSCIVNTVSQVTDIPKRICVTVNKSNLTHDTIMRTGVFNVSVLSEEASFDLFRRFGFSSGRDTDKFEGFGDVARSSNGILYLTKASNAFISAKVVSSLDCGTHTIFIADVTEAQKLNNVPSVTYDYYFKHIKPKPQPEQKKTKGYVCKICGYVYEGDTLPSDFVCPLCKHGAEDFEPIN